ncbi:hypothetical protein B0T17DRAFT_508848 [Bombardia bombarda]|uniref:Store-operated calcium entry-associated regulatory factor n=1 Tax=Bombardia bombarda TaxID=252184 RepID=A0AA40C1H5_9PEZI|nr:hypothetical protein B0T17DRAFT_508848 [Bombardia bombarda]
MRLDPTPNHRRPPALLSSLFLQLLLLLLPSAASAAASIKPPSKNAILLSDVQSLTLRASLPTTHRRLPSPIPQLKCISHPSLCALHAIPLLRCVNQGPAYDPQDIQWACTATDMPSTLKLGSTDVICEGYSSPDDPYILRGSCGVEYRLVLTEEGERRYPNLGGGGGGGGGEDGESDWAGYIFGVIFFSVLAWVVWSACVQANANRRPTGPAGQPRRRGWGGGGGGGGGGPGFGGGGGGGGGAPWNDSDDPPPPYPGTKPSTQPGAAAGWRPGFWSGLAGGAAAAYLAGNRGGRRDNSYGYNYGQGGGVGGGGGGYGSTWGGGGSPSSPSGSSGSSSTARHESTGFGSTSRR